jgi:RHS repeat-associated protein
VLYRQKLGKKVYDSGGNLTLNERYFDELLMQNGKLRRLQHADGFINLSQNGTPVEYFYYLKDHLGNVRATLTNSSLNGLTIHQTNDYYPFGMSYTPRQTGMQASNWENKYKYNGKEEQEVPGGWLDYGARYYDPALARFHTLDPLAETYSYQSPFVYAANNPIRFIDFMGMSAGDYLDQKGNYLGTDGVDDKKNYVVKDKKEAKQIKKATKNGENYTRTVSSKVELPGLGVKSAMGEAVDRAGSNSFHEEGGVIANMSDGSKKVVNAKPGADADPSVDGYASINVMDAANPSEVKGYGTLDGTFHTHPDGTVVNSNSSSNSAGGTTIGGTTTTSEMV